MCLLARAFTVLAVAVAIALAPAPASAATPLSPCASNGLLCATLTVPLDRTGFIPGQVSLYVEELPAPGPPRGVLMLLAGGPGQGSADAFELATKGKEYQALFPGYTLVAYDDRGTGKSGALDCSKTPVGDAVDAASFVGACLGVTRLFYTTRDHAEDMEAVRVALGVEKLGIYGASYGTKQAVAYALAHPASVERLLLDSEALPEGDPLATRSLQAIPGAIRSLCSGGACRSVSADPVGDFVRLTNEFRARPISVKGVGRLDGTSVILLAYVADINPAVAVELPAAVEAARRGWTGPLVRLYRLNELFDSSISPIDAELLFATDCGDGPFPWNPNDPPEVRQAAIDAAVAALPPGSTGPFGTWATTIGIAALCKNWPAPAGGVSFGAGPLPDVPVLVLSGDRDVRTPTAGAVAIAARFPQGHVLVIPGAGHSVLRRSDCIAAAVRGWLDGAAPPTTCPRVPLPVPPLGRFRRSRSELPAGSLERRTLAAALATFREGEAAWLTVRSSPRLSVNGLAGGTITAPSNASLRLTRYSDVSGVTLDGSATLKLNGDRPFYPLTVIRGTVTVGGKGAHGTLRIAGGRITGRLGGLAVSARA